MYLNILDIFSLLSNKNILSANIEIEHIIKGLIITFANKLF